MPKVDHASRWWCLLARGGGKIQAQQIWSLFTQGPKHSACRCFAGCTSVHWYVSEMPAVTQQSHSCSPWQATSSEHAQHLRQGNRNLGRGSRGSTRATMKGRGVRGGSGITAYHDCTNQLQFYKPFDYPKMQVPWPEQLAIAWKSTWPGVTSHCLESSLAA